MNLREMRTGLACIRHAVRSKEGWGKRHLTIGDSLVTIGAFSKGRSSSPSVLHLCRRMCALVVAFGLRLVWRWIPTDRNLSDGPSRGYPIGVAPKERKPDLKRMPKKEVEKMIEEINKPEGGARIEPILRQVKVKVLRFLHLCSGHRREGDLEDWMTALAADRGYMCVTTNVDVGFGEEGDLTQDRVVRRVVAQVDAGVYHGGHGGPPCASWSKVRWLPGGPGPLRDRARPWGLPNITDRDKLKVKAANALLLACLLILQALWRYGSSGTLEHPADPGRPPFPSIWNLEIFHDMVETYSLDVVTFAQCHWGCVAQKMTTIAGKACDLKDFDIPCTHKKHEASLCGVDATGHFRTRVAQAYPSAMCKKLAECHLDYMIKNSTAPKEDCQMNRTLAGKVLDQWREDRQRLPGLHELPASFLAASG
jgi:hypothetical protein